MSVLSRALRGAVLGGGLLGAALLAVPGAMADGPEPGMQPWLAGASNMGICSAFLGSMQVRDDVNHIIQNGVIPNLSHPGELYRIRAQQRVNRPPQQECLPRNHGGS